MMNYEQIRKELKKHYDNNNVEGMTWGDNSNYKEKSILIHLRAGEDIKAEGQLAVQLLGYITYRSFKPTDMGV